MATYIYIDISPGPRTWWTSHHRGANLFNKGQVKPWALGGDQTGEGYGWFKGPLRTLAYWKTQFYDYWNQCCSRNFSFMILLELATTVLFIIIKYNGALSRIWICVLFLFVWESKSQICESMWNYNIFWSVVSFEIMQINPCSLFVLTLRQKDFFYLPSFLGLRALIINVF